MEFGCAGTVVIIGIVAVVAWARADAAKRKREAEARENARRQRWEYLVQRFGHDAAVGILAGRIWRGQTADMLIEALGRPLDVDERVLKSKTKHVYKYHRTGANRYALKVDLENGIVVGWDQK